MSCAVKQGGAGGGRKERPLHHDSVVFTPQYGQQMSPLDSVLKYVAVLMPPHVWESVVEEMAFKCLL